VAVAFGLKKKGYQKKGKKGTNGGSKTATGKKEVEGEKATSFADEKAGQGPRWGGEAGEGERGQSAQEGGGGNILRGETYFTDDLEGNLKRGRNEREKTRLNKIRELKYGAGNLPKKELKKKGIIKRVQKN